MTDGRGKITECKGICTDNNKVCGDEDISNSESDSVWKTPSKLKEEVQTIIDIMGPPLSPKFSYNTSSEADNEESIFSNSKFSVKYKPRCDCYDCPEIDVSNVPCKEEVNISTVADVNTTSISSTMDDVTETKLNLPYDENRSLTQYICPPPLLPTNVRLKCFCPQNANNLHGPDMPLSHPPNNIGVGSPPVRDVQNDKICTQACSTHKDSKYAIANWLKTVVSGSKPEKDCQCQFYKMNVKKKRGEENSPPRRVVFELVPGVPNYDQNNGTVHELTQSQYHSSKDRKNMDNEKISEARTQTYCHDDQCKQISNNCTFDCPTALKKPIEKTTYCDTSGKTRVDVYYFDHGSFNHYHTTDAPPIVTTEAVADKTEKTTTRFWAEIFGTIHIGMSFVTSFILQLLRFLLNSIVRPLTIGIIQLTSDYFFKPMLATVFNGVLQPVLIFFFNIATSLRDLCDPLAEGIGYFLRELAVLIGSFRIVEVRNETSKCHPASKCERKFKKDKDIC